MYNLYQPPTSEGPLNGLYAHFLICNQVGLLF